MKKTLFHLLIILFQLFSFSVKSQNTNGLKNSFKPLPQINKEFLVVAHLVLDQKGIPGIDSIRIVNQLNELNKVFAPISASFKLCKIKYVENYQYNIDEETNMEELLVKYRETNRLNLYYIFGLGNPHVCGNGTLGGITSPGYAGVIISKFCGSAISIAHAFGHFFNLLDTNTGQGKELVDGSNCAIEGDLVCDTPADPYDFSTVPWINECLFINKSKKDAKGNYYEPDVSNIMSFYPDKCNCLEFTHDQYTRMAEYYLKNPVSW